MKIRHTLRGNICYAFNNSLLELSLLKNFLLHDNVYGEYMSFPVNGCMVITIFTIEYIYAFNIMSWFINDAWVACGKVMDDAYMLLELHIKVVVLKH